MRTFLHVLEGIAGLFLAFVALSDLFDTVITPGQSHAPLHVSRRLVKAALPVWKRVRGRPIGLSFAPLVLVGAFAIWMLLLVLAFALMLNALDGRFTPPIDGFGQALYLSGAAVVTLGISGVEPHGLASVVSIVAGFCGLASMTLAVTYMLEVQSNIAHRDAGVLKITTSSGDPPSALALLERYAALDCRDELLEVVRGGRDWCATVLQSHATHPSLIYFRSAGTQAGWPATLGALVDLALVLEHLLVNMPGRGASILLRDQAERLAHELGKRIGLQPATPEATLADVEALRARLVAAGYAVREDCDLARFLAERCQRVAWIDALSHHLGTVPAPLTPPPC